MASVPVHCRYCQSESIYKHGYARSGEPRYRCRDCQRSFQLYYHHGATVTVFPKKLLRWRSMVQGLEIRAVSSAWVSPRCIAHLKKIKTRHR